MRFLLTIYDHTSEGGIGYHFRDEPDEYWKSLVTKENTLVRKLDKDAVEDRLAVKVNENKMYLIKSKRIVSGGRNAVKTVSLMIDFEFQKPIWESEFENLISKALDTTSNGGEVRFVIPSSQFPESISEYIACQNFNRSGEFSGFSTDEIMSIWSLLPPDTRLNTNVIIGDYTEDELHRDDDNNCWFVKLDGEPIVPIGFLSSKISILPQVHRTEALESLRRSIIVADSTGFLAEQWLSIVAAEMNRRQFSINQQNHLPIRLLLSSNDVNQTRQSAWRRNSVETLSSDIERYAEQFYQLGGLLKSTELSIIEESSRIVAITPSIEDHNGGNLAVLLEEILEYLPILSQNQIIELLKIMPLDDWSEGEFSENFEILMVTILENNRIVWNYLLSEVSVVENYDYRTVKQLKEILKERSLPVSGNKSELIERLSTYEIKSENLIRLISKTNTIIESGEYIDSLLRLRVENSQDSLVEFSSEGRNYLYLNIHVLFRLNWDNELIVAETIGRLHARNVNNSGIELCVSQLHNVESKNHRALLAHYIKGLESVFILPENRPQMADVALIVARFTEQNSVWYTQIFENSSMKEIKQIMIQQKLTLNRLPASLILKLYSKKPRLYGWPSWIKKPIEKRSPMTVCRLHLHPTLGERLRIVFGYSMLLFSLLMFLACIGKYLGYVKTEILIVLTNDADLPTYVNDYILMAFVSLFTLFIHIRYRKHIKMLRRYVIEERT